MLPLAVGSRRVSAASGTDISPPSPPARLGSGEPAQAASRVALANPAIPTLAKRFKAAIGLEGCDIMLVASATARRFARTGSVSRPAVNNLLSQTAPDQPGAILGRLAVAFAPRTRFPADHARQGEDGLEVGLRRPIIAVGRKIGQVGAEAGGNGRVHGVGRREGAKQEAAGATKAPPACRPQLDDASYVGGDTLRQAWQWPARQEVHGAVFAQVAKARMHFGANGPSVSARLFLRRPQLGLGVGFGEEFQDRQAVPNRLALTPSLHDQHRHVARRGVRQDLALGGGLAQGDQDLLERNAGFNEGKPGAQAPARHILAAYHESIGHDPSPPARRHRLSNRLTLMIIALRKLWPPNDPCPQAKNHLACTVF